ncbi:MAG: hypothetical protein GY743_05330 [Planctomycetaceae bacterium]|nr:hypothetical protein [Planctomycetaceae bacterium]
MNLPEKYDFDRFIGIDYSGAGTACSLQKGIAVYKASPTGQPIKIQAPPTARRSRNWSRLALFDWLNEQLQSEQRLAIGIDHAFSFPISYYDEYQLESWPEFLKDFVLHWPTDSADATVQQFREGNARNGDAKAMRITDRWTAGPKSVFQFDVQGSVAKSTHAGLPLLFRLREAFPKSLQVWPFDGWEPKPNHSVIFEVFPSLFRNRYPREDRSVDQQDAYAVCRWLKEMQRRKRLADYFQPPLDQAARRMAQREGWIFGVL